MTRTTKPTYGIRTKIIASAIALAVAAGAAGTYAVANDVVKDYDHFVNCFDFVINDPMRHERNCLPNKVKVEFGSLTGAQPNPPAPKGT